VEISIAEEKEIDKKWCKEESTGKAMYGFTLKWSGEMQGGLSKALCTGLVLLFVSVITLLPISTLRSVVNSLGAPHRECAMQIKMRVQNWKKRVWGGEKRRGRTGSRCVSRHVSLCDYTCSVTCG